VIWRRAVLDDVPEATSVVVKAADRYAAAGVDRCLYQLPDGGDTVVTNELDRLAELIA
jgi:hypothetical protein